MVTPTPEMARHVMFADVLASLSGGRSASEPSTSDGQGSGGMEVTTEIGSHVVSNCACCGSREETTHDAETQELRWA